MKKYILKRGACIGKPGLPNGKLEAPKDKDLPIKPEYLEIIKRNLYHFVKSGKIVEVVAKQESDADKLKAKELKKLEKAIKKADSEAGKAQAGADELKAKSDSDEAAPELEGEVKAKSKLEAEEAQAKADELKVKADELKASLEKESGNE